MAYRPTNDVQENIIHRNTIFDSQGMVSCCTCGYCIKKTEDAKLILTNFKPADPLINENSIGSNIIEFSDYMIPSGSFEYVLTPTSSSKSIKDSSLISDYKFSDGLIYYPFLKCNGIKSTEIVPSFLNVDFNEFSNYSILYNSNFAANYNGYYYYSVTSGVGQNVNFDFADSRLTTNGGTILIEIGGAGNIFYDENQFGSYFSAYGNFIDYSNTEIKNSFYNPHICDENPPDPQATPSYNSLNFTPCKNQNDFYFWSGFLKKTQVENYFKYFFVRQFSYALPIENVLSFSPEGNYNLYDILNFGPNENYFFAFKYLGFPYYSGSNIAYAASYHTFLPMSDFASGQEFVYFVDGSTYDVKNINGILNARTYWYETLDSSQHPLPCSQQRMINYLFENPSDPNEYNIQSFLQPITTPLPRINLGDYQSFFNYINTNEYSWLGFKSESNCTNNIVKIMNPVFFKSFDDYEFSFQHQSYALFSRFFGITDKFIAPNRTSWNDCHGEYTRADLNPFTSWEYTPPPITEAKTVLFSEMNSTVDIYKNGYILHSFQFNKDGSFNGKIGVVQENSFYSAGMDSTYYTEKTIAYLNDEFGQCGYGINRIFSNASRNHSNIYGFNNFKYPKYSSKLLYSGKFIDADPYVFIEYEDNETSSYYTNGLFKYYHTYQGQFAPMTYYQDACRGYIGYVSSLDLEDYVAQKTNRTKITSKTDSSGLTTVTIENVLWVGKTLLTQTYSNDDGENRPRLANNIKVPSSYYAFLKGGFESDVEIKFQSVPICKNDGIIDRMRRVNQIKVNFENYGKIPQENIVNFDYENYFIEVTPGTPDGYFNLNATGFTGFSNIAFSTPNINQYNSIYLKNNASANIYTFLKKIEATEPPFEKQYVTSQRMVYPDFGVPDKFKSGILVNGDASVWVTGKEIKFGTGTTSYYCIFIEEIKDEKQNLGQTLIKIATTVEDAFNGIYIPDVGLQKQFKNKSLKTTIQSEYEDSKSKSYPKYSVGYDPNQLDFLNLNAQKFNANYSLTGEFPVFENGEIGISNYSSYYPLPYFFWTINSNQYLNFKQFDKMEIISLSPLKIKYFGCRFYTDYTYTFSSYLISNLITPDNVLIPDFIAQRDYGFMCDIVIEEVVDEFIEEALPVEFNQILENVEYIQTSNLMNSRKPLQTINPEKCEHIGKVIDRKDCNCPKKWIRECDLHGKTDWKRCMTCRDFKEQE